MPDLQLILNATRLAVSKEARESAGALVEMFRRSPEWQQDICTVDATVPVSMRERAVFLEDLLTAKLESLEFIDDARDAFRICIRELTANAFEHGGKRVPKGTVRVVADICPSYAAVVVQNPRGGQLQLERWLTNARFQTTQDAVLPRGRGLLLTASVADSLEQLDSRRIKAVVYFDRVITDTNEEGGRHCVHVIQGHSNPALGRRLMEAVRGLTGNVSIVLDGLQVSNKARSQYERSSDARVQLPTTSVGSVVAMVAMKRKAGKDWRISTTNKVLRALLPKQVLEENAERVLDDLQRLSTRVDRQREDLASDAP